MIGALPIFQANQLTQAIVDIGFKSYERDAYTIGGYVIDPLKLSIGIFTTVFVSVVIVGGIKRIGSWAGRLVPVMIVFHFVSVTIILIAFAEEVPRYFLMIFTDAFFTTSLPWRSVSGWCTRRNHHAWCQTRNVF